MSDSDGSDDPGWTIRDLSQSCGLTPRVLRHWESVGILTASRTTAGHRRYGPVQVTRVFRAVALRRAGLSLHQTAALLDEQDPSPSATLRAHLDAVDTDLRRRSALRDRLATALGEIQQSQHQRNALAPNLNEKTQKDQTLMKVIGAMTMFEQYVHGYHSKEENRLQDQANTLSDLVHHNVRFLPGTRVLEVGCGVGAQTTTLLTQNPGIDLTALDISATSLRVAEASILAAGFSNVQYVKGDIQETLDPTGPLPKGRYDDAFVCFILEHLEQPQEALRNVRKLLKPGGTITVIEGDHGSTYFYPDNAAARDAIDCQVTLQRLAGGDALIGRQLYPLLASAGFKQIEVQPRQVYVDASQPSLVDGFIRRTFTAMISGVREQALAAGLIEPARFDEGIRALERTTEKDGVFCYTFFSATAITPI